MTIEYFCSEADIDPESVVACGYFLSPISKEGKLHTIADSIGARGWFVALTDQELVVVETRAPATSKPLLENQGVQRIARSEIIGVHVDAHALFVRHSSARHRPGLVALGLKLKNRHFPSQPRLIEELTKTWGDGETLADLRRAQRVAALKRYGFIVLVVAAVLAFLFWSDVGAA